MLTDTKPEPSKPGRRRSVLSWVWIALLLVLSIVFIAANWVRALQLLLFVFIFFSTMDSLRDKPIRWRIVSPEERKETPYVQGFWGSLFVPGCAMFSAFMRNISYLYILDRHELVLPMVLVFAICMLAWLPFALRNPKRIQALLVAAIFGTPICTEARYLGESHNKYIDELELPDGSVVGVEILYYTPKITPLQPNDMVDFKCYQGPLGIRYAAFHIDDSWKGNPFAITYNRLRDWFSHR